MIFNKEMYKEAVRNMMDEYEGVPVLALAPNTSSSRAGVQPKDLIVSVNNKKITCLDDYIRAGRVDNMVVMRVAINPATRQFTTQPVKINFEYSEDELKKYNKSVEKRLSDATSFEKEVLDVALKMKNTKKEI